MVTSYRSPGVYREEVFLQSQVPLPTGVPAFVGFADAIAPLNKLPPNVTLPNYVSYDSNQSRLVCAGVLAPPQQLALLALSSDFGFQQAVAALIVSAQAVVKLRRLQEFSDQLLPRSPSYLAAIVAGFFANGGDQCYLLRLQPGDSPASAISATAISPTALTAALQALDTIVDLDLVAIPDVMADSASLGQALSSLAPLAPSAIPEAMRLMPELQAIIQAQQAVLAYCTKSGDRLAILDAFPTTTLEVIKQQRNQLSLGQQEPLNAALYYPWLKNQQQQLIPACGHMAGIIARSDRERGVFKAPANEPILAVLDLAVLPEDASEITIDNRIQDVLNPEGINCLRAFPGRGILVWGSRTLNRDPTWRYLNVRRVVLTLGRWIDRNMQWATFEPNSPRLWIRIQRELTAYLEGLWQQGALQGVTPNQAFFVKCDSETNPPESREVGQVFTEIGLAITAPAEFVIVRIVHH